jgi:hypothetical protein
VIKPLADEITLRQFAVVARHLGADLDALIADNLFLDPERSRRWTVALTRFAITANGSNREHLQALVAKWRPLADEIVESGSRLPGSFGLCRSDSDYRGRCLVEFFGEAGLQSE